MGGSSAKPVCVIMERPSLPARRPYAGRGRAGARSAWRRTRTGRLNSDFSNCGVVWRPRHNEVCDYLTFLSKRVSSQTLTVASRLPETRRRPSGLKAKLLTRLV